MKVVFAQSAAPVDARKIALSLLVILAINGLASSASAQEDVWPPKIVHKTLDKAERGKVLEVTAQFYDQSGIFEPKVYYRRVKDKEFASVGMVKIDDYYKASIPQAIITEDIEYFIEAFDENGNGPARHGTPENPHLIAVVDAIAPPTTPLPQPTTPAQTTPPQLIIIQPPPTERVLTTPSPQPVPDEKACSRAKPPAYCKWWFWTIIGVVVVGGATGVGVYFGTRDTIDNTTPSTITINVVAPDPRTSSLGVWP